MSVGVKLAACLDALGLTGVEIQFDHDPALGLREFDPATGKYVPDEHDPRFIRPRPTAEHRVKTHGAGATTAGSDIGKMKKLRHLREDPLGGEAFRAKILEVKALPRAERKKWPSRPFGRLTKNRSGGK